jgi:hypothetical protein
MTSFFTQNYILPECKPEWNREAITVFSRLPSLRRLQATPLLQPSLGGIDYVVSVLQHFLHLQRQDKRPKVYANAKQKDPRIFLPKHEFFLHSIEQNEPKNAIGRP